MFYKINVFIFQNLLPLESEWPCGGCQKGSKCRPKEDTKGTPLDSSILTFRLLA